MKILALDLATKTGYACNEPQVSGVENFAVRREESPGMRFVRFNAWLTEMVETIEPDLIVYEQAHHRGGPATAVAEGLIAHTLRICAGYGIEHSTCHTGTLKKFATGKGNASKKIMMEAFRDKFNRIPIDDNEADACWLLEWAKAEWGEGYF